MPSGTANGTLIVWTPAPEPSARTGLPVGRHLLNLLSGSCLDDPDAVTTNGTQQQIWEFAVIP